MSTTTSNLGLTVPELSDDIGPSMLAMGENFSKLDAIAPGYRVLQHVTLEADTMNYTLALPDVDFSKYLDVKLIHLPATSGDLSNTGNGVINVYPNGSQSYHFIHQGVNFYNPVPEFIQFKQSSIRFPTVIEFGMIRSTHALSARVKSYALENGALLEYQMAHISASEEGYLTWGEVSSLQFYTQYSLFQLRAGDEFVLIGYQYKMP